MFNKRNTSIFCSKVLTKWINKKISITITTKHNAHEITDKTKSYKKFKVLNMLSRYSKKLSSENILLKKARLH